MTIEDHALILVAVIPSPADLEIARVLGWYRIPYRSAPKTVLVDYVAFYQPALFGAAKWQIAHYAAVRGHELLTRAELFRNQPNHPHADALYFKLQLGHLQQRVPAIRAQNWRRVTFLYTTGSYFNQANDIGDLVISGTERELLWQGLREQGIAAQTGYTNANQQQPAPDLAIFCALGNLAITLDPTLEQPEQTPLTDSWAGLHLPQRKLHEQPQHYLSLIAEQVRQLGGSKAT